MKRTLTLAVLSLFLAATVSFAAAPAKTATGIVKSVSAGSLVVTAGSKDWTFNVDKDTKVIARGASHKTAEKKTAGEPLMISDVVKEGAKVRVKYHDMGASGMHAAEVRVM